VAPPGSIFALWDDTTGVCLGGIQSDGSGHATLVINDFTTGQRWLQGDSNSNGSSATIQTFGPILVTQLTGLSVALGAAQAGMAAGLSGALLTQAVSASVAAWSAGTSAGGRGASPSASQATITTLGAAVQAQLTGLGATAGAAVAAAAAGIYATSASGATASAVVSITTAAAASTPAFVSAGATLSGVGTVAMPTGIQAGDVLLMVVAQSYNGGNYMARANGLTGWTNLFAFNASSQTYNVFWYRATGSDTAPTITSTTWSATANTQCSAFIAAYRGCVASGSPVRTSRQDAASGTVPRTFSALSGANVADRIIGVFTCEKDNVSMPADQTITSVTGQTATQRATNGNLGWDDGYSTYCKLSTGLWDWVGTGGATASAGGGSGSPGGMFIALIGA
jgi:hypothetical protein